MTDSEYDDVAQTRTDRLSHHLNVSPDDYPRLTLWKYIKLTPAKRRRILMAGECLYCGSRDANEHQIDHIIPRSRGGSNDDSNLACVCRFCNNDKSDLMLAAWAARRLASGSPWPPEPYVYRPYSPSGT